MNTIGFKLFDYFLTPSLTYLLTLAISRGAFAPKKKRASPDQNQLGGGDNISSASADGGLAPWVRARGTFRSNPHRH